VTTLDGVRIVAFESRRAEELARMLERHGATVTSAPALRETPLDDNPALGELRSALEDGRVSAVILLTGVGTRALAAASEPGFITLLDAMPIIARGPKPLAALRELGVAGALHVHAPFTWREVLPVVDGLGLPKGSLIAVQEYGTPPTALVEALEQRGHRVLRVPVYRWALPQDTRPLEGAATGLCAGDFDVAVFTSAVQAEHLFRVAKDADALRAALNRAVVASIGPVCSEGLEAHGVHAKIEASPPKMGPLVAAIAAGVS
jgi:uroporphyrinogen-III synthase